MADYVQKFKPGAAVTFTATTAIVGGRLVAVTGDRSVGTAGAASAVVVGVAAFDAKVGDRVTVFVGGIQELVAVTAVTAGATVASAADGKVAAGSGLGLAISTAAAGGLVQVIIGGGSAAAGGGA